MFPERVMETLLKYTYDDEDSCPSDTSSDEIDYLVQVKGLTPYQATITECWISAKCEFYEESDIVDLESICDNLKRGTDTDDFDCCEYRGLLNLLVTLYRGEERVNDEYYPHPDGEWYTYVHEEYVPPRQMESLFDLTKEVVVTKIHNNVVKDMIPPMLYNDLYA
jgi:hypothetical protein